MTRAQNTQTFNTATKNAATDQSNAQQLFQQNQGQYGTAQSAINNLYANPGYDAATKGAITSSGQDANNAAFDALSQQAAGRATRTNNGAGYSELADSLAMQKGQGSADAAMKAQTQIGNAALSDKDKAISDMAQLYGLGNSAYGTTMGGANNQLGLAGNQATANKGFWDTLGGSLAGTLGQGLGGLIAPKY